MESRGCRPKRGRIASGASIVVSSAGHAPPAIGGWPAQPERKRASTSANASPASPRHKVSAEAKASAVASVASINASGAAASLIRAARADVRSSRRSIRSRTMGLSVPALRSGLSTRARIAASPAAGFRPRRNFRSRRRVASRSTARSRPSLASGCFSSASKSMGANPLSTAARRARSSVAGGESAKACRRNRRSRYPSDATRRRHGGQDRGRA